MKVLLLAAALCLSFCAVALACAQNDHIYIDPRLAIQRPHYSSEQMQGILADPTISEEAKGKFLSQYHEQDQPIKMPFSNGYVLISSLNPCIQQFIPLR
jgi:hypothetical protein